MTYNVFESELPYSYKFWNASLPNEERSFCQLCPKLVAMATSLGELEKEIQINHLQTNTYYL